MRCPTQPVPGFGEKPAGHILAESSTVEWQSAHWIPTDCNDPDELKKPVSPTTAFNLKSATVVAGSTRLSCPLLIWPMMLLGGASTSTFRPRPSAAVGVTPAPEPPMPPPMIPL